MTSWAIISLSWKNVWRNPVRSSVVVISVILAIWASLFILSIFNGLAIQFVDSQLGNYTSHIQIHEERFMDERMPEYFIPGHQDLLTRLDNKGYVVAYSPRTVVMGLASSATNNFGVQIVGIDTNAESKVSGVYSYLIDGNYLEEPFRNAIFIGNELARRLSLDLRSRMVLTFQDVEGNLTAGAFRVSGIFRTPNAAFNENTVYVNRTDLQRLIGAEVVHEIAIITDNYEVADEYKTQLTDELTDTDWACVKVRSWGDISPALRYMESNMALSMNIIMVIIIIALCFGIINTMLMAVIERTQELGMLRAVGMNKRRTFAMIMLETGFLSLVGAPVGLFLSWITISALGGVGLDFSMFSKGLEMFGFESVIYPYLQPEYYTNITVLMAFAAVVSAIFPALKALKLNPVEAIRKL